MRVYLLDPLNYHDFYVNCAIDAFLSTSVIYIKFAIEWYQSSPILIIILRDR